VFKRVLTKIQQPSRTCRYAHRKHDFTWENYSHSANNVALMDTRFLNFPITRIVTRISLLLHLFYSSSHYHPAFPINPEIVPVVGSFNTARTPSIQKEIPSKIFPGFATTTEFRSISNDGIQRIPSFINQQTKYLVSRKAWPCPLSLQKRVSLILIQLLEKRWFVDCHWYALRSHCKGGGECLFNIC
jgi:hypothetical protein